MKSCPAMLAIHQTLLQGSVLVRTTFLNHVSDYPRSGLRLYRVEPLPAGAVAKRFGSYQHCGCLCEYARQIAPVHLASLEDVCLLHCHRGKSRRACASYMQFRRGLSQCPASHHPRKKQSSFELSWEAVCSFQEVKGSQSS